jgi:Flp pilus assembly pilin Flp
VRHDDGGPPPHRPEALHFTLELQDVSVFYLTRQQGQTTTEYAVTISVITVAIVLTIAELGDVFVEKLTAVVRAVEGAS